MHFVSLLEMHRSFDIPPFARPEYVRQEKQLRENKDDLAAFGRTELEEKKLICFGNKLKILATPEAEEGG